MKAISITGLVIAILSFLAAMYLQFILAPACEALEVTVSSGLADELTSHMLMAAYDTKVNLGMTLVISGGLSFIMCLYAAVKTKGRAAFIGTLLSFIALLFGLLHGTHLFS